MVAIFVFIVALLLLLIQPIPTHATAPLQTICDARQFGAAGDNQTEDTAAVQAALRACTTVVLVANHTFLLRPVELYSNRHLQIDGIVAAWRDIATWPNSTNKKCGLNSITSNASRILVPHKEALLWGIAPLSNISVSGSGTVDGQGWRWWPLKNRSLYWHHCRPQLLALGQGNVTTYGSILNVVVSGVTFKDSPWWTISGRGLQNATFHNVTVTTTGCGYAEAPNTDGFNIQGKDIVVKNSFVRNGDDCVPIFPPSRNVLVQNVTCTCGNPPAAVIFPPANQVMGRHKYFAGDIENVRFDQITCKGTSSGIAIKSMTPFIGTVKNVSFTNFILQDVNKGMAIDFFHQGIVQKEKSEVSALASADLVVIENVTGTVSDVGGAGHINCLGTEPCLGLRVDNVQLTSMKSGAVAKNYSCLHVSGTFDRCSPVPCVNQENMIPL